MREGEIVINEDHVRVMQEAAPCQFTIDPDRQTVTNDAENASVTVSTYNTCTWTARSNAGWLTITAGESGNGNGTVAFRVGFERRPHAHRNPDRCRPHAYRHPAGSATAHASPATAGANVYLLDQSDQFVGGRGWWGRESRDGHDHERLSLDRCQQRSVDYGDIRSHG